MTERGEPELGEPAPSTTCPGCSFPCVVVASLAAVADAVIVDGKGNVVEDGPVDYNAVGHRL